MPGIEPHQVRPDDRCTYWFYMLRVRPGALRCDRAEFVKALAAEGVPASAGYIPVPALRQPGLPASTASSPAAGRSRRLGLTSMDYAKVSCPEAEAILEDGRPRGDPRGHERGVRPQPGRGRPQGRRPLRRLIKPLRERRDGRYLCHLLNNVFLNMEQSPNTRNPI